MGTYEYGNAIQMLNQLVAISTPEQIKVYDKIIGDKAEFAFYSGIVSTVGLANVEAMQKQDPMGFDRGYKKNSLAWLLALARVEIGSTMAMYGKSKTPFVDVAPAQFGLTEYLAVLFDDLSSHILALSTDMDLKRICKMSVEPDSQTLAYLRRLKLVGDMLAAVQAASNPQYAQAASELSREVDKYRDKLATKVLIATTDLTGTSTSVYQSNETSSGVRTTALGSARSCRSLANSLIGQTKEYGRTPSSER